MKIQISYYGQTRQITGIEREKLEVDDGSGVLDVIRKAADSHGEKLSAFLFDKNGKYRRSVLLSVNDEMVEAEGSDSLSDNDKVSIFPAIAGG